MSTTTTPRRYTFSRKELVTPEILHQYIRNKDIDSALVAIDDKIAYSREDVEEALTKEEKEYAEETITKLSFLRTIMNTVKTLASQGLLDIESVIGQASRMFSCLGEKEVNEVDGSEYASRSEDDDDLNDEQNPKSFQEYLGGLLNIDQKKKWKVN